MQKVIFGLFILISTFSHSYAQEPGNEKERLERRTELYAGITIERVIPNGWGSSVNATIQLLDAHGEIVNSFKKIIHINESILVDVRELAMGNYTIKVYVNDSIDAVKEIKTTFFKKKNFSRIELKFVNHCALAPHSVRQRPSPREMVDKPVIYLYPPIAERVEVKLNFNGKIEKTIPDYDGGWLVNAAPNGSIKNDVDGKEYPYLFWEGETYGQNWNMQEGFVVSADSARQFLENILPRLGLTPVEYHEFIDFWAPRMQKNKYNIVHFAGKEYEDLAKLEITPHPDAILRVFMVFEPATKNSTVSPQQLKSFIRKGFTVVEWGGTEIDAPSVTVK